MSTPPKPTPYAIVWSLVTFATIVLIGSFHSVIDAISMGLVFVSLPWFAFYFLDWLGGDVVRRMRDDIEKDGKRPKARPKSFRW